MVTVAPDTICRMCLVAPDTGETHENCPRNAVRASRRNARVAASVVGHGEWVVDDVSGRGHYEVRQGVQGRRQADEGSHPGRGDVGDRLVAGQRPASADKYSYDA